MALTLVQRRTSASAANVTTLAATWSPAPVQNNLILCRANSDATVTMSSSGWTLATSQVNLTGLYLWYKIAGAAESTTVTITPSASASTEMIIEEYSGNATTSVLDKFQSATGATTGTTAATTQADELAIAQVGISNAVGGGFSATWNNSFVATTSLVGVGTVGTALHPSSKALAATGTVVTTATPAGGGTASGGLVATFKASGAVNATVNAVAAMALGDAPAPAISAGAAVTVSPALALGSAPVPTAAGVTAVSATPAMALGDAPSPALSSGVVVIAPAALALGSVPVPIASAANVVIAPAALALGSAPAPSLQASAVIFTPAALALGDAPAPAVSATATAIVIVPAALAHGSAPSPAIVAAAVVLAPSSFALGSAPAPLVFVFTPAVAYDLISPWFTPGTVVDLVPLVNANERAWAHERVEQRISQPYKLVIPIRPRQTPVLSAVAGDDGVARFLTVPPGKYWIIGEIDGVVRRVARTI